MSRIVNKRIVADKLELDNIRNERYENKQKRLGRGYASSDSVVSTASRPVAYVEGQYLVRDGISYSSYIAN